MWTILTAKSNKKKSIFIENTKSLKELSEYIIWNVKDVQYYIIIFDRFHNIVCTLQCLQYWYKIKLNFDYYLYNCNKNI